jgi:hypothetical protein
VRRGACPQREEPAANLQYRLQSDTDPDTDPDPDDAGFWLHDKSAGSPLPRGH